MKIDSFLHRLQSINVHNIDDGLVGESEASCFCNSCHLLLLMMSLSGYFQRAAVCLSFERNQLFLSFFCSRDLG